MNLEKIGEKKLKKIEKGKGGASRPRPHFWPTGRSRPSPPTLAPFPALAPAPCPRARTAALCRRGELAELGRHVARMRRLGRALVGHQVRPAASAFAPAARHAPPLALSLCPSPARSSSRTAARHCRRRSELSPTPAPTPSLPSATTSDSASSFRTPCSRSITLGESRAPGRAHRSESELRRPLGLRGSPSPLRLCLRSRMR